MNSSAPKEASTHDDYGDVTERPGQKASGEQLSMLFTRYDLAAKYSQKKVILEIACGTGIGLGYLAQAATKAMGGDIDPKNIEIAKTNLAKYSNASVSVMNALQLPFEEGSIDSIFLFEAIYYLPSLSQFVDEVKRVLKPGGHLIISSVNSQWKGFNPSPFSTHYPTASEFQSTLQSKGFDVQILSGFLDNEDSALRKLVSKIRQTAVRLNLIPKTMSGKAFLKRIFYGKMKELPSEVYKGCGEQENLVSFESSKASTIKMLYVIGKLRPSR